MDEDFADMLMMEEMNVQAAVASTPAPAPFVPAETKQKQKNRDKKKQQQQNKDKSTSPAVELSDPQPIMPTETPLPSASVQSRSPTAQPVDEVKTLFDAFGDIQDAVPDLFESSAKIAVATKKILPIPDALAIIGVAAVAGVAVYLTIRRQS